jgi:hypothetical protein
MENLVSRVPARGNLEGNLQRQFPEALKMLAFLPQALVDFGMALRR